MVLISIPFDLQNACFFDPSILTTPGPKNVVPQYLQFAVPPAHRHPSLPCANDLIRNVCAHLLARDGGRQERDNSDIQFAGKFQGV
jgi:hypothetical protein